MEARRALNAQRVKGCRDPFRAVGNEHHAIHGLAIPFNEDVAKLECQIDYVGATPQSRLGYGRSGLV